MICNYESVFEHSSTAYVPCTKNVTDVYVRCYFMVFHCRRFG